MQGVSRIIRHFAAHLRLDFSLPLYAAVMAWVGSAIAVNYSIDLEDGIIDPLPSFPLRWACMWLLHMGPWAGVCLLLRTRHRHGNWWGKPSFWLLAAAGFAILAFDRAWQPQWPAAYFNPADFRYAFKVLGKLEGNLRTVALLGLLAIATGHRRSLFGLRGGVFTAGPYLWLLAAMAVVIAIGSQFADIQSHYPRYLASGGPAFAERHAWPSWLAILCYELPYGLGFIPTELFFRGFLVVGLSAYMGRAAVLPMVAAYAALHFGKPLTETISSVAGGFALGVLALHHRNIWGGVLIHVGIAWLMEIIAALVRP